MTVDEEHRERILALAVDVPAIWRDPTTPQRERKRMLALLVEDVTLLKQRQVTAHVRVLGGATTTLTLPRPPTAWELRATSADARQQTNALLDEDTDAQVAAILKERGLRTGAGEAFDAVSVQWVRSSTGLTSLKAALLAAGMLTGTQIAAQLGVRRTTIGRWRHEGRLEARICNEMGQWPYAPHPASTSTRRHASERRRCARCQGKIPCWTSSMKGDPSPSMSSPVPAVAAGCGSSPPCGTRSSSSRSSPTWPARAPPRRPAPPPSRSLLPR